MDKTGKKTMKKTTLWFQKIAAQAATLVCVAAALCCFVAQKEGYHMDELLSFELSNAQFNPWIVPTQPVGRLAKYVQEEIRGESFGKTLSNLADTVRDVIANRGASKLLQYKADVYPEPVWISGEQFHEYLTVGKEDAFSYLSVYFNVKDDNHPPLHFMLLHTMSSFFRNTIAPFQGCVINILAILGCCLCFFALGALLERHGILPRGCGKAAGICASLLYGLSGGGIATALLIRMYGVMTFFCVALFYLHLRKWLERGFDKKNKCLAAVTVCGFLTQYFFLFYCLVLAALVAGSLAVGKRYQELKAYIRTMLLSAVIGVAAFPFSVQDVFASGRGTEALENLGKGLSGYGERLAAFGGILVKGSFGSTVLGAVILACTALWLVLSGIRRRIRTEGGFLAGRRDREESCDSRRFLWSMLLLPCAGYFLLAARMSPYLVDRYIMPLFPFAAMLLALFLVKIFSRAGVFWRCLLLLPTLALGIANLALYDGTYLYRGYERQLEVAEKYGELPCICLYDGLGYYYNLMEFTQYERTLLLTLAELEDRQEVSDLTEPTKIVVLKKAGVEEAEALKALGRYGWEVEEELFSEGESVYGDTIYLCVRQEENRPFS